MKQKFNDGDLIAAYYYGCNNVSISRYSSKNNYSGLKIIKVGDLGDIERIVDRNYESHCSIELDENGSINMLNLGSKSNGLCVISVSDKKIKPPKLVCKSKCIIQNPQGYYILFRRTTRNVILENIIISNKVYIYSGNIGSIYIPPTDGYIFDYGCSLDTIPYYDSDEIRGLINYFKLKTKQK